MSESNPSVVVTSSAAVDMTSKSPQDIKTIENHHTISAKSSRIPSRRTSSTFFKIANRMNRVHRVIHPSSADVDDDFNDDMNSDEDEVDSDLEEPEDGDEPIDNDPHRGSTPSHTHLDTTREQGSSSSADAAPIAQSVARSAARDTAASRYNCVPERITEKRVTPVAIVTTVTKTETTSTRLANTASHYAQSTGMGATRKDTSLPANHSSVKESVNDSSAHVKDVPSPDDLQQSANTRAEPAQQSLGRAESKPATKADPLAPTAAAPYGYRIVKVKKPDGTISTVKRPIKEGQSTPSVSNPASKPLSEQRLTFDSQDSAEKHHASSGSDHIIRSLGNINATTRSVPLSVPDNIIEVQPHDTAARMHPQAIHQERPAASITVKDFELSTKIDAQQRMIQITEKEVGTVDESQNATTELQGPLRRAHRISKLLKIVGWVIMMLFPLFFLTLAVMTIIWNGKHVPGTDPSSKTGDGAFKAVQVKEAIKDDPLTEAIKVGASIWPIVFAAVVAQSLKMYAAYRVERGIQLVTLEQLISSHSVGGALKQPFMLRTLNWTSVLLFAIWGLSPLAGQAMLRMSFTSSNYTMGHTTVKYFSPYTRGFNNSIWYYGGEGGVSQSPSLQFIFNNLLLSYTRDVDNAQDPWNNLKIPTKDSNLSAVIADDTDYHLVSFVSLVGVPFLISNNQNQTPASQLYTEFPVNSSYFDLDCSDFVLVDDLSPLISNFNEPLSANVSFYFTADNNTYISANGNDTTNQEPGSNGTIHFGSRVPDESPLYKLDKEQIWYSRCSYTSVMVASYVTCLNVEDQATCFYDRGEQQIVVAAQPLPLGYWFPYSLRKVADDNPLTALIGSSWPSIVEKFIANPGFAIQDPDIDNWVESNGLAQVNGKELSQRLGLVINTMYNLGFDDKIYLGADDSTFNGTSGVLSPPADWYGPLADIYQISWEWVVILIVCSVLLAVAAGAAAIWETRVVGPDFLGFANTAIKKNVKMPASISAMNAKDRLHALRECEVLLQDLKPAAPVGRIVLGVKEDTSARLVPGRNYR